LCRKYALANTRFSSIENEKISRPIADIANSHKRPLRSSDLVNTLPKADHRNCSNRHKPASQVSRKRMFNVEVRCASGNCHSRGRTASQGEMCKCLCWMPFYWQIRGGRACLHLNCQFFCGTYLSNTFSNIPACSSPVTMIALSNFAAVINNDNFSDSQQPG